MIRKIETVYRILGTVFMSIGGAFIVLSAILTFIALSGMDLASEDVTALYILTFVFLGMGLIFFIMGLIFFMVWRNKEFKASRLKNEGICYDAEITDMKPSYYANFNGYNRFYGLYSNPAFTVECCYTDQDGKTCLVKSGGLLAHPMLFGNNGKDGLRAKVYVNRDNPRDYYVDVTMGGVSDIKVDNDYR